MLPATRQSIAPGLKVIVAAGVLATPKLLTLSGVAEPKAGAALRNP